MRLFIGLPLPDDARENTQALAAAAQREIPGRYVLASNYHLTLSFLGEVEQERLFEVKEALEAFAARFPAPVIHLDGLAHFSRPQNAILVRAAGSASDLAAMRDALNALLDERDLPHTDGPFCPHVTLARHADVTQAALDAIGVPGISFAAREAVLFLSARDEDNALRYTPLKAAAFFEDPQEE